MNSRGIRLKQLLTHLERVNRFQCRWRIIGQDCAERKNLWSIC
jgi:hypothetical protein